MSTTPLVRLMSSFSSARGHRRLTPTPLHSVRNFVFTLAFGCGFAFLAALYLSRILGHDQAWCLYAAARMSEGTQIYSSQLIETNPPLILWFSLVPVALARLTHLPEAVALHLVLLALTVAAALLCHRLLARSASRPTPTQRLLFTTAIFFVAASVFPGDLGQREQLLVLFLLPVVVIFATGATTLLPRRYLFFLGLLAGIALCFKPQQITVLLALQLGVLLRYGPRAFVRRPEWIAILGAFLACLSYVAAVRFLTPGYLLTITPILVNTYWALGRYTFWQLMRTQHHFPELLLVATVVFLWGNSRKLLSAAPGFLLLAAAGACLGYGIQHAGFPYHRIPQNTFLELAFLWMAIEFATRFLPALFAPTPLTSLQSAVGILAFAAAFLPFAHDAEVELPVPAHSVQGFLRSLAPGTPVWSLTVDLSAQFPEVLTSRLVWGSRFNHLWMLPAIQQNLAMRGGGPVPAKVLPFATLQSLEDLQRQAAVVDLARWQPRFILVPRCRAAAECFGFSEPFDTLAWFRQSPSFAAAWSRYRYRDTLPNLHNNSPFDLYERQDSID